MKYFITAAITGIALCTLSVIPAGALFTWDWPVHKSYNYKVEAHGTDIRVYEWESPSDPTMICASAHTQAGPVGFQCWKKSETAKVEYNSN